MPFYPLLPDTPPRCTRPAPVIRLGQWHWVLVVVLLALVRPVWADFTDDNPTLDFEALFEEHGVVMLLIDPESGAIRRANSAAAAFYGMSRGELEGLTIQDINTFTPQQVAEERQRAETEERNYFLFRHRVADGVIRKVEVVSHPYEVDGRVLLLSIIRDATTGTVDDVDLLRYQEQLERQVDAQIAQMERIHRASYIGLGLLIALLLAIISYLAYVIRQRREAELTARRHAIELSRAHADLHRFAEIASHHLMEPARRLVSYSGKLRRDLPLDAANETIDFDLDAIDRAARRQHDLIGDIQLYLAASEPQGEMEWLDVASELSPILAELESRVVSRGGRIEVGPLPPVYMDRGRLRLILSALLTNAVVHGVPERPPVIHVRGERDGGWARLSVLDNGPGIPVSMRDRAFRIFERLRHDGEGTGIGLPMVRRIVEGLGGRVTLADNPPEGTRIDIALPLPHGESVGHD